MSLLFDVYVVVDWSAAREPGPKKPKKDALWMAWRDVTGGGRVGYFRTREALMDELYRLSVGWLNRGLRILAGFDFAFGYPAGFADGLQIAGDRPAWEKTWELLASHPATGRFALANELNSRCGELANGPFWGLAGRMTDQPHLTRKRTGFTFPYPLDKGKSLRRLRHTDAITPGVQEVWKLAGIGSVGSQTLTGIPHLQSLRTRPDLGEYCRIWPFETGFAPPTLKSPVLLLAEMFPSQVPQLPEERNAEGQDEIRDRRQVRSLVHHLATLDRKGKLKERFSPPASFDAGQIADCLAEEGCIFTV